MRLEDQLFNAVKVGDENTINFLIRNKVNINAANAAGDTAVHIAAKNGRYMTIVLLIGRGANIHGTNKNNETPLLSAANSGQFDIVDLLIKKGANTMHRDNNGNSILLCATQKGDFKTVVWLLQNNYSDIDEINKKKQNAIDIASIRRHNELLQFLINYRINSQEQKSLANNKIQVCNHNNKSSEINNKDILEDYQRSLPFNIPGLTYQQIPRDGHCLFNAVGLYLDRNQAELRNIVSDYIQTNIDNPDIQAGLAAQMGPHKNIQSYINALRNGDEWADNLEISCLMHCFNRPIFIIQENGKVKNFDDIKKFSGEPIFVYYNGHNHYETFLKNQEVSNQEIIKFLIQKNNFCNENQFKNVNGSYKDTSEFNISKNFVSVLQKNSSGESLLHNAAWEGNIENITNLLKKGCAIDEGDNDGQTPLHKAVLGGKLSAIKVLLRMGAPIEARDNHGNTPLLISVINCQLDALELLLENQANINAKDNNACGIVHLAIRYKKTEVLGFLSQKQIKVDYEAQDQEGLRPLHYAVKYELPIVIKPMIDDGANLDGLDYQACTPLHLAIEKQDKEMVNCLINDFGANLNAQNRVGETPLMLAKKLEFLEIVNIIQTAFYKKQSKPQINQNPHHVTNLVFQGGGVKGIAYLGAIKAFSKKCRFDSVERVAGTSAGAITALLIGLGYRGKELKKILLSLDFKEFLDGDFKDAFLKVKAAGAISSITLRQFLNGTIKQAFSQLDNEYGLFKGEVLRSWVEKLIFDKTGIKNATFAEIHALKKQGNDFKDLYFIGTNINTSRSKIFSFEHTPDVPVADALRISVAIPLFFTPYPIYIKDKTGKLIKQGTDLFIDGGVVDNYPIWLFDNSRYISDNIYDKQSVPQFNRETLGFRLASTNQKKQYEKNMEESRHEITSLASYIWTTLSCFYEKQESDHKHSKDYIRTIYIDDHEVNTIDFDLNERSKKILINSGKSAVASYFKRAEKREEKLHLNSQLLSLLTTCFDSHQLSLDEQNLSLKNIKIRKNVPDLVYHFYKNGQDSEIVILNKLGISINASDNSGRTALLLAIADGDLNCVKRLIRAKAKLDVVDSQNNSALDYAFKYKDSKGYTDIIFNLIKNGLTICKNPIEIIKHCEIKIDKLKEEGLEKPELENMLIKFKDNHNKDKFSLKNCQVSNQLFFTQAAPRNNLAGNIGLGFIKANVNIPYLTNSPVNISGLLYKNTVGEGDCFYHAVALCVNEDAKILRNLVLTHFKNNIDRYKDFVQYIKGQSIQEFINDLESRKAHTDNLEINILMHLLARPIVIIGAAGRIENYCEIQELSGKPIFVYHKDHCHYDALLLQENFLAQDILDSLVSLNAQSYRYSK